MKLNVSRFNIYSCLTLQHNNMQICFDPAKIRESDIDTISPDIIFISHESMDHMDPSQVYILQKKKNCKIFCSIACAIDLTQAFPYDYEFIDSINALIPGAYVECGKVIIETQKSIHCDYMLPLIFKITFKDTNISVLHCFDSLLSDDIIKFSKNTSLAIIPVGIAKGVSASSGLEFIQKLSSYKFITNHLKSKKELDLFKNLLNDKYPCKFLDWNESAEVELEKVQHTKNSEFNLNFSMICNNLDSIKKEHLMWIASNINYLKTYLIKDKSILNGLYSKYEYSNYEEKIILLCIFISISLLDSNLITKDLIEDIKNDLSKDTSSENNNLHTVILLFLSVYAQQSGNIFADKEAVKLIDEKNEHNTYWVVEFLGRCIVSNKNTCENLINEFMKILKNPNIYNSVVVRRKIFWELYRIMKVMPSYTEKFANVFEDGLTDSNPDVELLATLCFGLANRVYNVTSTQLEKIFNLLKDPEDDVREIAVKTIRKLNNKDYILSRKFQLFELINDSNCHVQHEAKITKKAVTEWEV